MHVSGSVVGRYLPLIVLTAGLVVVLGCAEGPLWRLGILNPWARRQWAEDARYGPTLHQQVADLAELRARAASLDGQQQEQVCQELVRRLGESHSPPLRTAIARTLGEFPTLTAARGLEQALADSEPQVRIAACQGLGRRGDRLALDALARTVGSETNVDVRLAATRELAAFADPVAVQALGVALSDTDPALQRRAIASLRDVSGRDYGDDVTAWRTYVAGGEPVQSESPSLAERLRDLF